MPKSKKRFVYRGCEESSPFFKELRSQNKTVVLNEHGKWVTVSKKSLKNLL